MPKMKTHKAIKSKFTVTAGGKLKFRHPERRHKLTKKSSKRKRSLARPAIVAASHAEKYARLIGV